MRRLRDLAKTYSASGLVLVGALVAAIGWLVTHLAWASIEALHGQVEPRIPPDYLFPLGTVMFTVAAVLVGVVHLRRGR